MKMNRCVRLVLAVMLTTALATGLAGCRQSDGAVPMPADEQVNKTADIGRDLLGLASKSEGAVNDLTDDLLNVSSTPPPLPMLQEIAGALDRALAGKAPSPEAAQRLAESVFVVVTARDLSERQIETLQTEVTDGIKKAGGDDAGASAVAASVAKIQAQITANPRRWYHFF